MGLFKGFSVLKTLSILAFGLGFNSMIHGQIQNGQNGSNFWNNVQFGGGIGLSFGDGFVSGTLAPIGVYRFNEFSAAGIGLNATYSKQRDVFKT